MKIRNKTKSELENELKSLEIQYKQDKKRIEKMLEEFKSPYTKEEMIIAEFLHDKLCNHSHTDGCSWFYDDGSWSSWDRIQYTKKAQKFIEEGYDIIEIEHFFKTLKG